MRKALGARLVEANLVPRSAVDQLAGWVKSDDELADALVQGGWTNEVDVLRFLAGEYRTRFVTSEKLAQFQIPQNVLDVLPLETCLKVFALPLFLDPERKILSVVMADPRRSHSLDDIPRVARMNELVVYVGLRSAILGSVRKHYQGLPPQGAVVEPHRFACPSCGAEATSDQLECAGCGLLLNPDAATGEFEVEEGSVVRALLSETTGRRQRPEQLDEDDELETAAGLPVDIDLLAVPRLAVGFEAASQLSKLEAYLVSHVDGRRAVAEIARLGRVSDVEARSMFSSLAERRIVTLRLGEPTPEPDHDAVTAPGLIAPEIRPLEPVPPIRLSQLDPAPDPLGGGHLLQRALVLEQKGDFEQAIGLLKYGIARTRKPAPLYNRLALILVNQRKAYDEGEQLLRKALELEPGNEAYRKNLMMVLSLSATAKTKRGSDKGLISMLLGKKR